MTEVVDTTPVVEDRAATSDDDASIMTEDASPPETEDAVVPKEEQKADAFLAYILNLWAMFTCKVKEIDEDAGIRSLQLLLATICGLTTYVWASTPPRGT